MTEKSARSHPQPSGSPRSSLRQLLGIAAALLAAIVSAPAGTTAGTADELQADTLRRHGAMVTAEQHRRALFEQRQQAWIARTGQSMDAVSQGWRWPAQESGLIVRAASAQSR